MYVSSVHVASRWKWWNGIAMMNGGNWDAMDAMERNATKPSSPLERLAGDGVEQGLADAQR